MNIKEVRESRNMTQEELANLLGVNRTAVSMWETRQSYPTVKKLIQMAEIFGCTVDELIKHESR